LKPDGKIIVVRKLVLFCKENNIDYKNLRKTFNCFKKDGTQSKHKGFCILQQKDPF
jgi:hypothetical protein